MKSLAPGLVVGSRYVLTRPLAKGGMGSVWIARHRELEVDVTVKFMMPTLVNSPELRARFEREAKVAARLRSQYVVQVLDFGIDDEMPYIAMELLQGENLGDRLKRDTRLSLAFSARILTQICKALRTAHEAGLVHRDLKPGNIFLALKDGEEVVKVLDFGIVKDTAKNDADEAVGATDTGVMMGSVHYMSPEQIRSSRQVDHRSDLWSVAVILYKMLTGNAPFPGTNHGDVMVRVCTDDCPPPSSVVPGLSPAIDAFFVRALTREPSGRFQSAQEMTDAFAAASNIEAAPPTALPQPPPKWVKTLPLLGQSPEHAAARAAAMARAPLPSSSPVDSARSTAMASTTPLGSGTTGRNGAAMRPQSNRTLWILLASAGVVVLIGTAIFLQQFSSGNADARDQNARPNASGSSASSAPAVQVAPDIGKPSTDRTSETVQATAPVKRPGTSNPPTSKTTAATAPTEPATPPPPASTAAPANTPPPNPRRNPLDIND